MTLHLNPLEVTHFADGRSSIFAEAWIAFPEGTQEFDYISAFIEPWEYYVSQNSRLPKCKARIEITVTDDTGEIVVSSETDSKCSAFIYGWMPGHVEWFPGQCTAFVSFILPMLDSPASGRYMLHVSLIMDDIEVANETTSQIIREQALSA